MDERYSGTGVPLWSAIDVFRRTLPKCQSVKRCRTRRFTFRIFALGELVMPFNHSALLRALFVALLLPFVSLSFGSDYRSEKIRERTEETKDKGSSSRGKRSRRQRSHQKDDPRKRRNLGDEELRSLLADHGVEAIDTPQQDSKHVSLGQLLFFDRIICGNNDTACATCHHPMANTTDMLSLGIGTGSPNLNEIGVFRGLGEDREFIPRNAPDIFNRGSRHWTSMFWDSRVSTDGGNVISPAGASLPPELTSPLQIQAMFPPTSRDEMRGSHKDVLQGNKIATFTDDDFTGIWNAIFDRIMQIEEYRILFASAFPQVDEEDLGFQHVATALAAFEAEAFGFSDSPFDEFLRGDKNAMSRAAKRGASLFFGKATCSDCHTGTLLTDQQHHNLAVPQLGPGKDPVTGLDFGRSGVTGDDTDLYAFRTPPLRNVAATGPWMHNGAFTSLEDVIDHHLDPERSLKKYDERVQLIQPALRDTVLYDRDLRDSLLDYAAIDEIKLSREEKHDLIEFLHSLTAPDLTNRLKALIPVSVPSGMLEDGLGQ